MTYYPYDEKIYDFWCVGVVHRDPLHGDLFPSVGGYGTDGKNLSMDVPHIRGGRVCSAPFSIHAAVLPPVAEGRVLYVRHFPDGIPFRVAPADTDGSLPMGLQRKNLCRHGVHPSGLCTPLGDAGVTL